MYSVNDIKELANKLDGTDNDIPLINKLAMAVTDVYTRLNQEKSHFIGVIDYGDNCGCDIVANALYREYQKEYDKFIMRTILFGAKEKESVDHTTHYVATAKGNKPFMAISHREKLKYCGSDILYTIEEEN